MSIAAMTQVLVPNVLNPTLESRIGWELFFRCMSHFRQVLGQVRLGLSYGSCCAAVAMETNPSYDSVDLGGGERFSVLYGSSRLFSGLDPDFNRVHGDTGNIAPNRPFSNSRLGEHAEQSAIRTVRGLGLNFYEDPNLVRHIYIDLTPCGQCEPWLVADPGDWHVHYFTRLAQQQAAVNEKKRGRREEFGTVMARKRPRVGDG